MPKKADVGIKIRTFQTPEKFKVVEVLPASLPPRPQTSDLPAPFSTLLYPGKANTGPARPGPRSRPGKDLRRLEEPRLRPPANVLHSGPRLPGLRAGRP